MPARPAAVQIVPPGRLAVGLQLPVAAQSTLFAQPWERDAGVVELTRVAKTCDRAGFFYVAVCDHVCVPRAQAAAMSTIWYDAVATLGFLAAATKRVRLLSYVYVPAYRHPLATAKALPTSRPAPTRVDAVPAPIVRPTDMSRLPRTSTPKVAPVTQAPASVARTQQPTTTASSSGVLSEMLRLPAPSQSPAAGPAPVTAVPIVRPRAGVVPASANLPGDMERLPPVVESSQLR